MFFKDTNTYTPEFLKAATMQSHNCEKYLQICANLGLMNANQEKLSQMLYLFQNFTMFSSYTCFLRHLLRMFLRKFFSQSILIAQTNLLLESLIDPPQKTTFVCVKGP